MFVKLLRGYSKLLSVNVWLGLVQRRVGQFNAWLSRQPEKIVVAYGHSIFWRDFMLTHAARREKLRNCEYFEMLV